MPEEEIVDALPVLAEVRPIERPSPTRAEIIAALAPSPAVQAAAVAATGILTGAVCGFVVRRVANRQPLLPRRRRRGPRNRVEVLTTRSFLVDVSLVDRR